MTYQQFFGFTREPFGYDLGKNHILQTESIQEVEGRMYYALRNGGIMLVTGEVVLNSTIDGRI
jgi:hypothetical protein